MRHLLAVLVLVLCLFGTVPPAVSAHATPTSYVPVAGASVLSAPSRIEINFSEHIEPDASGIKVLGQDGVEIQEGKATLDSSDPRHLTVGLKDKGDGVYTVSWQVVSVDDGHFTKGSYSFLVSHTGEKFSGTAEAVQVLYVTRFSEAFYHTGTLIGESIFLGVLFFTIFVLRVYARKRMEKEYIGQMRKTAESAVLKLVLGGGVLFVAGTLAVFIQKSSELAGLRNESFATGTKLFAAASGGGSLLIKIVLGLLFMGCFFAFRKGMGATMRRFIWQDCVLFVILAGLVYLQSKVSHAAASFFYPELSVDITIFHLFFKEMLIGSLAVFLVVWASMVRSGQAFGIARITALYDGLAAVAIFFGGVSGTYITWLHLKRFENLFMTEWGERYLMLLSFGVLLFGVRLLNQFVLGLRARKSPARFHIYRTALALECAFGMMILMYSAYISITTPPFIVEQSSYHTEIPAGNYILYLEQHPYEGDALRVGALEQGSRKPIALESVLTSFSNKDKGISNNVVNAERRTDTTFSVPKTAFAPSGTWDVRVVAKKSGEYDSQAEFTIHYPQDIAASTFSDKVRTFDSFARIMVLFAVLIALFACALLAHAYWRYAHAPEDDDAQKPFATALPMGFVLTAVSILVVLVTLGIFARAFETSLETKCVTAGFDWKQALPARDMEPVSPNSYLGCWMHGGHYHIVDEAEYDQVLKTLTLPPTK